MQELYSDRFSEK